MFSDMYVLKIYTLEGMLPEKVLHFKNKGISQ